MGTINEAGLQIDAKLHEFVAAKLLAGTAIEPGKFWAGFAAIVADLSPEVHNLLGERDRLQAAIDARYESDPSLARDPKAQEAFLREIGWLVEAPASVAATSTNVDDEIAKLAGPQLVVPATNARYALNAANARWGSLYDAFYGTDLLPDEGEIARGKGFNDTRAAEVVRQARVLLDTYFPLAEGSHAAAIRYAIHHGTLAVQIAEEWTVPLRNPAQFVGYIGNPEKPDTIALRHNGLHFLLRIDPSSRIGARDHAGIADITAESALSTIIDFEDSVATVDAEDKLLVYGNWLGLMQGSLSASFPKGGKTLTRTMEPDIALTPPDGRGSLTLHGRSLLLVRSVGHHMFTDAVTTADGQPVPEGFLDALIGAAAALHDLARKPGELRNSRTGSVYIVKPKMHGPAEVALTETLFGRIEQVLGLPALTLKMGVMDEERRTSANLAACIAATADRIVFINTGFLDRTGDEIHTAMRAGPVVGKAGMKRSTWLSTYEQRNVAIGLECGLKGRAQIGKGMWAMPDRMADMREQKRAHPQAGANTAWVPSPTAATIHALHYHEVDVAGRQAALGNAVPEPLEKLLTLPLASDGELTDALVQRELDNNVQSILGYVVRWVDQGVGCSKVPDLDDIGLMEDRATLRISSQALANWLAHGVLTEEQVDAALRRIAPVVDRQNADDAAYTPMAPTFDGPAFSAARALIFDGTKAPNGYTEPTLTYWRQIAKARQARAGQNVAEPAI